MIHHEPDRGDRVVCRLSGAEGVGHAAREEQSPLGTSAAGAKGSSSQPRARVPRGRDWKMDWATLVKPVARELLGDPQRRTPTEWRYRGKGSLAIHVAGPRRGTWRDHEAGVGGGVLELVEHIAGTDRAGALGWLRWRGLLARDGKGRLFGSSLSQASSSHRRLRPGVSGQGQLPENRSTVHTGSGSSDTEAPKRRQAAETAWTRAEAIPIAPEHPARLWMARRHLWRPDLELPPSVRWLPAERWHWRVPGLVGAIVAAFGRPNNGGRLSGVELIHVNVDGRPILDRPKADGGIPKRNHGSLEGAVCVLGLTGRGGANVAEGLADALALAARLPGRAVCMGGTAGFRSPTLAAWLAQNAGPHGRVWADLDESGAGLAAARALASAVKVNGAWASIEHVGAGDDPGAAGASFNTLDDEELRVYTADLEHEGLPGWEAARVASTILTH